MCIGFAGISALLKTLFVLRMGAGPRYIGTFGATGAMAYAGMSLPAGLLGARFGVRRVLRTGGLVCALGMALLPFAVIMPESLRLTLPIICEVITASGWSLVLVSLTPALMAYTDASTRDTAFSLYAALAGAGGLVGLLIGGALPGLIGSLIGRSLDQPEPYALGLAASAVAMIAGVVPMILFSEPPQDDDAPCGAPDATTRPARPPFPWFVFAVFALYAIGSQGGWAMGNCFYNAYADTELVISPSRLGLISAIGQGIAVGAALLNPRLARRWGNGGILIMTTLGLALSNALLAACPIVAVSAAGRWGIYGFAAMRQAALQVREMELLPKSWRSVAFGALSTISAGSVSVASMIGGWMSATRGSYRPGFWLGAGLCVAGAVVAWGMTRQNHIEHA